jgi:hypothetical protein
MLRESPLGRAPARDAFSLDPPRIQPAQQHRAGRVQMVKSILAAGAAGVLLVSGAAAQAQQAGTPPSWNTLVRCAEMGQEDARLACYDEAMRSAGYQPKPEEVAAEKRRRFGLSLPQINVLKHHEKEEGEQAAGGAAAPAPEKHAKHQKAQAPESEDEITVELSQVATLQPDEKLVMFTSDGEIWQQTDTTPVTPLPREGDTVHIHKGKISGYFCDVNKYQAVRCKRER